MAQPPTNQQITFLYSRDLAETAHFYGLVLGLPFKLGQDCRRIYQASGDGDTGFCQRDKTVDGEKAPVIVTLVPPEVDAWYELLAPLHPF